MTWLSCFSRSTTTRKPASRRGARLQLESLEERQLLSSSLGNPGLLSPREVFSKPLLPYLSTLTPQTISTVPGNGDVNPYGIGVVPQNFQGHGILQPGDILVSNFNNSQNIQGTGTTITRISATGLTSQSSGEDFGHLPLANS
jgi:hypothetical protein